MPTPLVGAALGGDISQAGGRRGVSVKTLKRMLKKAGLKTSGRKGALTRRVKKAHLKTGGGEDMMGGRRRRRKTRGGVEDELMCDAPLVPNYNGTACVAEPMDIDGGRRRRRGSRKH